MMDEWEGLGRSDLFQGLGSDTCTPVPIDLAIPLPVGGTVSIFVWIEGSNQKYSNADGKAGVVFTSDANISFSPVAGIGSKFSNNCGVRRFNGAISYQLLSSRRRVMDAILPPKSFLPMLRLSLSTLLVFLQSTVNEASERPVRREALEHGYNILGGLSPALLQSEEKELLRQVFSALSNLASPSPTHSIENASFALSTLVALTIATGSKKQFLRTATLVHRYSLRGHDSLIQIPDVCSELLALLREHAPQSYLQSRGEGLLDPVAACLDPTIGVPPHIGHCKPSQMVIALISAASVLSGVSQEAIDLPLEIPVDMGDEDANALTERWSAWRGVVDAFGVRLDQEDLLVLHSLLEDSFEALQASSMADQHQEEDPCKENLVEPSAVALICGLRLLQAHPWRLRKTCMGDGDSGLGDSLGTPPQLGDSLGAPLQRFGEFLPVAVHTLAHCSKWSHSACLVLGELRATLCTVFPLLYPTRASRIMSLSQALHAVSPGAGREGHECWVEMVLHAAGKTGSLSPLFVPHVVAHAGIEDPSDKPSFEEALGISEPSETKVESCEDIMWVEAIDIIDGQDGNCGDLPRGCVEWARTTLRLAEDLSSISVGATGKSMPVKGDQVAKVSGDTDKELLVQDLLRVLEVGEGSVRVVNVSGEEDSIDFDEVSCVEPLVPPKDTTSISLCPKEGYAMKMTPGRVLFHMGSSTSKVKTIRIRQPPALNLTTSAVHKIAFEVLHVNPEGVPQWSEISTHDVPLCTNLESEFAIIDLPRLLEGSVIVMRVDSNHGANTTHLWGVQFELLKISPEEAEEASEWWQVAYSRDFSSLRIRPEPSVTKLEIAKLEQGQQREFTESRGIWIKMKHPPPGHKEGWCLTYNEKDDRALLRPSHTVFRKTAENSCAFRDAYPDMIKAKGNFSVSVVAGAVEGRNRGKDPSKDMPAPLLVMSIKGGKSPEDTVMYQKRISEALGAVPSKGHAIKLTFCLSASGDNAGAWHSGVVIGENALVWHPGLEGGQVRVEGPGGHPNKAMLWRPQPNAMHKWEITISPPPQASKLIITNPDDPNMKFLTEWQQNPGVFETIDGILKLVPNSFGFVCTGHEMSVGNLWFGSTTNRLYKSVETSAPSSACTWLKAELQRLASEERADRERSILLNGGQSLPGGVSLVELERARDLQDEAACALFELLLEHLTTNELLLARGDACGWMWGHAVNAMVSTLLSVTGEQFAVSTGLYRELGFVPSVCERFKLSSESPCWAVGSAPEVISFEVNEAVTLHGALIFGGATGQKVLVDELKLSRAGVSDGPILADRRDFWVLCDTGGIGKSSQGKALFERPILLEAGVTYCISLWLHAGGDTYSGIEGASDVAVGKVKFKFSKALRGEGATNMVKGQIPGLLFSDNPVHIQNAMTMLSAQAACSVPFAKERLREIKTRTVRAAVGIFSELKAEGLSPVESSPILQTLLPLMLAHAETQHDTSSLPRSQEASVTYLAPHQELAPIISKSLELGTTIYTDIDDMQIASLHPRLSTKGVLFSTRSSMASMSAWGYFLLTPQVSTYVYVLYDASVPPPTWLPRKEMIPEAAVAISESRGTRVVYHAYGCRHDSGCGLLLAQNMCSAGNSTERAMFWVATVPDDSGLAEGELRLQESLWALAEQVSGIEVKEKHASQGCHHCTVESLHPYLPACRDAAKISFPTCVKWIAVEPAMMSLCQPEDVLQIKSDVASHAFPGGAIARLPGPPLIFEGNELQIELQTASEYDPDGGGQRGGIRCTVLGYEAPRWSARDSLEQGIHASLSSSLSASLAAPPEPPVALPVLQNRLGFSVGLGELPTDLKTFVDSFISCVEGTPAAALAEALDRCSVYAAAAVSEATHASVKAVRSAFMAFAWHRGFLRHVQAAAERLVGGEAATGREPGGLAGSVSEAWRDVELRVHSWIRAAASAQTGQGSESALSEELLEFNGFYTEGKQGAQSGVSCWDPSKVQIGDRIDAKDEYFTWYTATVNKVAPCRGVVLIHFDGWAEKWDRWCPMSATRLAPLNTHTEGITTNRQASGKFEAPQCGEQVRPTLTLAVTLVVTLAVTLTLTLTLTLSLILTLTFARTLILTLTLTLTLTLSWGAGATWGARSTSKCDSN